MLAQWLGLFGNIVLYVSIFLPRWGSVRVNFMNHLDWPEGFHTASKTSFLDVQKKGVFAFFFASDWS